jgi:hypothetical protein
MTGLLDRMNLVQRRRGFKWIASMVLTLVVVGGLATVAVLANAPEAQSPGAPGAEPAGPRVERLGADAQDNVVDALLRPIETAGAAYDLIFTQMQTWEGAVTVLIGGGLVLGLALSAIWLGLGLFFLAALLGGLLIAWPLAEFETTRWLGEMLVGLVPLTLAFLTLMQLLRLALAGSTPVFAVARNVLAEAVRMKVSLVFIVLLLLLMALVPTILQEDQALRYRVQQWLTYGLMFSFGTLALLTVFLTVGTVAFEQRDKIIWQTMTKPVASWEYVLGKWVGVMALNLVLLTVSAAAVFMFTEYLRYQPAQGESARYVDEFGNPVGPGLPGRESTDRRILEEQVLAARVSVKPEPHAFTPQKVERLARMQIAMDDSLSTDDLSRIIDDIRQRYEQTLEREIERRLQVLLAQADTTQATEVAVEQRRDEVRAEVLREWEAAARSAPPNGNISLYFDLREPWREWQRSFDKALPKIERRTQQLIEENDLEENDPDARSQAEFLAVRQLMREGEISGTPELTLRYKVEAGANSPSVIYTIGFLFNQQPWPVGPNITPDRVGTQRVALGQATSLDFPIGLLAWTPPVEQDTDPAAREVAEALNGRLLLQIFNVDMTRSDIEAWRTIRFEGDGIEVLYDAGGYQLNFIRVVAIMWIKLGFIAAVGVMLASFLSFPVAALVTLAVLFAAENADFLAESIENLATQDAEGNVNWVRVVATAISLPITWLFDTYASLKPAESISDGRLLSWSSFSASVGILTLWTLGVLGAGVAIFRKRELAVYSGH